MLDRLVTFSLRNRAAVLFFTLVVAAWGWFSFRTLTIEAFPDPTDTQVNVITALPGPARRGGRAPDRAPARARAERHAGSRRLRNLSLFGLSFVTLTFNDGVDGQWARQQVLERLRDAELPDGVTPELGPFATPIGEVYRYTLRGAKRRPDEAAHAAGLGGAARADARRRRRRRRQLRRPGARDPRHARPAPRWRRYGLTLADLEQAVQRRLGERQRRRARARRRAVRHPQPGALPVARRPARGARRHQRRHAGAPAGRRDRRRGLGAAPGRGQPRAPTTTPSRASCSCAAARTRRRCSRGCATAIEQVNAAPRRRPGVDRCRSTTAPSWSTRRCTPSATTCSRARSLVTLVLFVFLLDLRAALIVAVLIPLSLLVSFIYLKLARHVARTCSRWARSTSASSSTAASSSSRAS